MGDGTAAFLLALLVLHFDGSVDAWKAVYFYFGICIGT